MRGNPQPVEPNANIEAALRRFYRWEVLAESPPILSVKLRYSGRDKDALTPVEKAADGTLTRSRLERTLRQTEFLTIDALHTVPMGQLRRRKIRACGALASQLFQDLRVPRAFIADQIRWWAGGPSFCIKSEAQWAEQLSCSVRTILYSRNGRPDRTKPGIAGVLDGAYNKALWTVESEGLV